jgi:hypothetical protein
MAQVFWFPFLLEEGIRQTLMQSFMVKGRDRSRTGWIFQWFQNGSRFRHKPKYARLRRLFSL